MEVEPTNREEGDGGGGGRHPLASPTGNELEPEVPEQNNVEDEPTETNAFLPRKRNSKEKQRKKKGSTGSDTPGSPTSGSGGGDDQEDGGVKTLSVDFDALLPHIGEMGRYQLVLYLLMCVPACLPASFLAFNQVFLSAVPDHWCHVSDLENSSLSLGRVKKLSIPRVDLGKGREAYVLYEKCLQYDVNFTQIYIDNGNKWPRRPDPDWPTSNCKEGWDYDHSEYKDTLVTEVSFEKLSPSIDMLIRLFLYP